MLTGAQPQNCQNENLPNTEENNALRDKNKQESMTEYGQALSLLESDQQTGTKQGPVLKITFCRG